MAKTIKKVKRKYCKCERCQNDKTFKNYKRKYFTDEELKEYMKGD